MLKDILSGIGAVFGLRGGTREPAFALVARLPDGVEVRRYGKRIAAETDLPGNNAEAAPGTAFGVLFRYISGANDGARRVAMTVPVVRPAGSRIPMTAPVAQDGAARVMRFFLPAGMTEATAPVPTDPAVRIVTLPEETVAVLRFTGRAGAAELSDRQADLLGVLDRSPWLPVAPVQTWFYDPPFTIPYLRRNEVAVTVVPRNGHGPAASA